MKIKSLEIENIGIIAKETIIFNEPLMLFIGKIKQGKTTILNCVKYVLGDKYPSDILRHGTDRGHSLIKFDNSSIKRVFRRKKNGTITADKIEFILNGELQQKPTEAIKQFLNPFLLNQDFFAEKTELERNRYFVELFGVDVTEIDKDIKSTDEAAKILRAKIDTYGEIDISSIEKADVYALKKQRQKIVDKYKIEQERIRNANTKISFVNDRITAAKNRIKDIKNLFITLQKELAALNEYLTENQEKNLDHVPQIPNTKEIDEKISDAKATNVKYERYLENKIRYDEKQNKNFELSKKEKDLRKLRADKIKQLAGISDTCGVPGLEFNSDGIAKYEGCSLGMISKGQIMQLSSALKSLYPEGFGLELIDGAESTGIVYGNMFGEPVKFYIDKAKRKDITILATVVGEKPTIVPDEVGVFIVEKGVVK